MNMKQIFEFMALFSVKTFVNAKPEHHLLKLKQEADEAIKEPYNIIEYADCLLALFGAVHRAGFTYEELIKASDEKLKIVQKRKWMKLTDGTYQHIKS